MQRLLLLLPILIAYLTFTVHAETETNKTVSLKKYRPICKTYTEPPPGGYKRWSDKDTWPDKLVPGIGDQEDVQVDIACDTGVILDISIKVDRLIINGTLKVIDKGPIEVITNYVIVQGRLMIGNESTPYDGKITFTLRNGTYRYGWTRPDGEDDAGDKAFIVLGGLVTMNGMYGNQKAWTKLTKTAVKSDRSITVAGDVSKWPVGGVIVIASTDYDFKQAERVTITSVEKGDGVTVLGLDQRLQYMHWGTTVSTGVEGVTIDESAEVALLNRTIVIQGDKDPNNPFYGGHMIIFQTQETQRIVGIELVNLGQRGIHGKYPLFFFLCQSVQSSIVQKISIHDSYQRCLVLQGTYDLTIDENVAFNTRGHCYFFEEGLEYGNTISNNLGLSTTMGDAILPGSVSSAQTDEFPATFWISNPNNTMVNNVAAGSEDTGFWFHFSDIIYGSGRQYPSAFRLYPNRLPLKKFDGNVAHSNTRSGFRSWPEGYRPRNYSKLSARSPLLYPRATALLTNFLAYKNAYSGVYIGKSDSITIQYGKFADNRVVGIRLVDAERIQIKDTIIVGYSENVGNPSGCSDSNTTYTNCEPLSGCSLPVDPSEARSLGTGRVARDIPSVGISFSQAAKPSDALTQEYSQGFYPISNNIYNTIFSGFDPTCRAAAAMAANEGRAQLFVPSHSSENVTIVRGTPPFYMAPRSKGLAFNIRFVDAGPATLTYVFRDKDGSLVGDKGGYVVANQKALLPDSGSACTGIRRGSYGYLCPGTCYRQMQFSLSPDINPRFTFASKSGNFTTSIDQTTQLLFVNLLAGNVYRVYLSKYPEYLLLSFSDPQNCGESVTLQFIAPPGRRWEIAVINGRKKCSGSGSSCSIESKAICSNNSFQLTFGGQSLAQVILFYNRKKFVEC